MVLGYLITESDLKCNMLENRVLNDCARYSNIYDLNVLNPNFKMKKHRCTIGSTYDGFTIVSDIFKQFCESEKYNGLEFVPLENNTGYYWFKVHNILQFDTKRRGTEFLNFNPVCDGYEEIIGATPACLMTKEPLKDSFFRTDICFGSGAGKSPLLLTGTETKEKLQRAGFKEIYFEKILGKYKWETI